MQGKCFLLTLANVVAAPMDLLGCESPQELMQIQAAAWNCSALLEEWGLDPVQVLDPSPASCLPPTLWEFFPLPLTALIS